jgi:leader peptidase (prepilin peptidase)/N-methyltransferase
VTPGLVAGSGVLGLSVGYAAASLAKRHGLLQAPALSSNPRTAELAMAAPAVPVREVGLGGVTAVAFAALGARLGMAPTLPAYWFFATMLVLLSGVDLAQRRVPKRLVYAGVLASLPLLFPPAMASGHLWLLAKAAATGAAAFLALALLHLVWPAGLGFGDVRLAGLVGLYLGFLNPALVVLSMALGFGLAALGGLALVAARRARASDGIPLVPFLAAGVMVVLAWGGPVALPLR